jgi:hypothetical protein
MRAVVPAHATTIEHLSTTFDNGASFNGDLTFTSNFDSITAVNGTLFGYSSVLPGGVYLGGAFPYATDAINQIKTPTFLFEPNTFLTVFRDDGPTFNQVVLEYSLINNEPIFDLAAVFNPPSGLVTLGRYGSISPVPLPPALPLFGLGLAGLIGTAQFKKKRAKGATV